MKLDTKCGKDESNGRIRLPRILPGLIGKWHSILWIAMGRVLPTKFEPLLTILIKWRACCVRRLLVNAKRYSRFLHEIAFVFTCSSSVLARFLEWPNSYDWKVPVMVAVAVRKKVIGISRFSLSFYFQSLYFFISKIKSRVIICIDFTENQRK